MNLDVSFERGSNGNTSKNFYERDFDGTFNDAEFILERTKELMNIQNDMRLEFLQILLKWQMGQC